MSGEERVPIDWSDQDVRDYVKACRAGSPHRELRESQGEDGKHTVKRSRRVYPSGMSSEEKRREYQRRYYLAHKEEILDKYQRRRAKGDA